MPTIIAFSAGVRLYQGVLNRTIPNYAMIAGRDFVCGDGGSDGNLDGINDGVWCQSAMNVNDVGSWKLPNGSAVSTDVEFAPIRMANRPGQVGLLRSAGIINSPYQGVYTCTIPDENGVNQTLVVWAGAVSPYDGSGSNRELSIFLHDLSLPMHFDIWKSISYLCNNISVLFMSFMSSLSTYM